MVSRWPSDVRGRRAAGGDARRGAWLNAFDARDAAVLEALAQQAAHRHPNARLIEELAPARKAPDRPGRARPREIATRITAIREPAALLQEIPTRPPGCSPATARDRPCRPGAGAGQWTYPRLPAAPARGKPWVDVAWAIETGRGVWSGDYHRDRSFRHAREPDRFVREAGLISIVAAPLVTEAGLVGVITVGSTRPKAYGPRDAERLEVLASQAAVALTTARLVDELGRSREEISHRAEAERTLREIAAEVTALRDPREVAQLVIRAASSLMHGDVAEIGLADDADPVYASVGATSLPGTDGARPPRVIAGIGVSGLAYRDIKVVRTGDYAADDRFEPAKASTNTGRHACSAIRHFVAEGKAFGAMIVVSRRLTHSTTRTGPPQARRLCRHRHRQRPSTS
jgi:GAF domain-containing protein